MAPVSIPMEVLGDALVAAIEGRRVRTAVFTTFTFDPGFFELHVLPLLFDRPFSQVEKVKLIQLEDALRSVDEIAVYYDRSALSQDSRPAQSDFRRIDVRRSTGVFHPKLFLALVESAAPSDDEESDGKIGGPMSLIVATLSANLTRAGWWENVETGHFEEILDREIDDTPCPFRKDVLGIVKRIRATAAEGEDHAALDQIHAFLLDRTNTEQVGRASFGGKHRARLYAGQSDLPTWLDELRLGNKDWNLEIISPYFDADHAETLRALQEVLEPRETRVYLPTNADGSAAVRSSLYDAVGEVADWCSLPTPVLRPGARLALEKTPPRRVHAKVYRLWRKNYRDIVLTGSVNLTAPAHSHGAAGNLEAAFLVDVTGKMAQRWWLEPLDHEPSVFAEEVADETEGCQEVFIDISFMFDWSTDTLRYRIDGTTPQQPIEVCEPGGLTLFRIEQLRVGQWCNCTKEAAAKVKELLRSTSFLQIRDSRGAWRVLVREEGMAHRPSLLSSLTPEEILMYWSLLSPEQREAFIEEKLASDGTLEGLPMGRGARFDTRDTLFDRFAGVYHAFERLGRFVEESVERSEDRQAESRMFGAKYDSLPVLLKRTIEREDSDVVMDYVTFLCAKQIRDRIAKSQPEFWQRHRQVTGSLDGLLGSIPALRESVSAEVGDAADFLDWYEKMFLRTIQVP